MSRRVSLPTADDLFRPTRPEPATSQQKKPAPVRAVPDAPEGGDDAPTPRRASGRIRHDEKMTIYVTSGELVEIEQTRLSLRGHHGLTVDRGRLVREALHLVLDEFEAHGEDSALVRRLRE